MNEKSHRILKEFIMRMSDHQVWQIDTLLVRIVDRIIKDELEEHTQRTINEIKKLSPTYDSKY